MILFKNIYIFLYLYFILCSLILVYFYSLSLFGSPLFSNVAHSTITPSYKPDNMTNRWFNGQPSVYIQQVTRLKLSNSIFP